MSPHYAQKAKIILVVDDDVEVVTVLREILGFRGYEVLVAQTAEQAIAAVKNGVAEVDLLVIDAVMPKMSGPELADVLLFLRPRMKVLFITGLDSLAIRLAFDQPCRCLQKPFSARILLEKVQEALGETLRPVEEKVAT